MDRVILDFWLLPVRWWVAAVKQSWSLERERQRKEIGLHD